MLNKQKFLDNLTETSKKINKIDESSLNPETEKHISETVNNVFNSLEKDLDSSLNNEIYELDIKEYVLNNLGDKKEDYEKYSKNLTSKVKLMFTNKNLFELFFKLNTVIDSFSSIQKFLLERKKELENKSDLASVTVFLEQDKIAKKSLEDKKQEIDLFLQSI